MKKIGIIRCQQTEDMCPGTTDFKCAQAGTFAFESYAPCEVVGFVSCGGCPGKKTVLRVRELVRRGADAIALASCISKGTPIGYPCPFAQKMKELIAREAPNIRIIEYTH